MQRFKLLLCLLLALPALGQPGKSEDEGTSQFPEDIPEYNEAREKDHWCQTDKKWQERRIALGLTSATEATCPTEGACDVPANRDATSVDPLLIDVIVHVMRDDNGNNGVSQATVNATMAQMNSDYANSNTDIQFNLVATRFHNDSRYACIRAYSPFNSNWFNDIQGMKNGYAETPTQNINIFISCQDPSGFGTLLGIATFPWDPDVLTKAGGFWLNNVATGTGGHTASHEMGHCLGLWHTHHGVSEVTSCGDCYEFANGFEGDERGDFASDTPPTPTNSGNCSSPGGSDCQGTPWGTTQTENYMSYAPDSCQTLFTAQQTLRMQCWSKSVLSGWFNGGGGGNNPPTASFTIPSINNLTASFDGTGSSDSDGTIVSYSWDFGDTNTGSGATTNHTYASAGTYTVTLTVTDDDGATDDTSQNVTVTSGGGGTFTVLDSQNFEGGWGIWNDGGSDCRRSSRDSSFAHQGTFCVRLRDNSGSASSMFTDSINLNGYTEAKIEFWYLPVSMEGSEDIFVEFNDGGGWTVVANYVNNVDFTNNTFENPSATIGVSGGTGQFRIRCDASGNGDRVYVDEVVISAR